MAGLYLLLLFGGIGCMMLIDRRFTLFFWHDPAVALLVTTVGTALFLLWDLAGIASGVFFNGESPWATTLVIAPELPLEEPVFLIFLVYCTMVVFTAMGRILAQLASGPSDGSAQEPSTTETPLTEPSLTQNPHEQATRWAGEP